MIIERFFGKGRAAQPETQPPQTSAPAQVQQQSAAPNANESKPRRPPTPATGPEATARRNEPTKKPVSSGAGTGGPAVADPAGSVAKSGTLPPPSYEEIAARAYDLWVGQGRLEGRDHDNWVEAERQLSAERARC